MIRKSLVSCLSIGLLALAACGGSPEATTSPSVSEPAAEPSATSETSAITSSTPLSETPEAPVSPDASEGPTSEPAESVSAVQIPAALQGQWIFLGDGEKAQNCSKVEEGEGTLLEVTADTISSFASLSELESVEESDATSMRGTFTYQDDSDELITLQVRLETKNAGQTLVYSEPGENAGMAPARYGRCT